MKRWFVILMLLALLAGDALAVQGDEAVATTQPVAKKKRARRGARSMEDVIDSDLVEQLSGGRSSARDTVDTMLAKMKQATELLRNRYEAGDKTQAIQEQIVSGIDGMIEAAEKAATSSKPSGKKRKSSSRPQKAGEKKEKAGEKSASGNTSKKGGGTQEKGGKAAEKKGKEADKADLARRWGFLPEQDREALLQGFDEDFMPKYRNEILRYYRNLATEAERE